MMKKILLAGLLTFTGFNSFALTEDSVCFNDNIPASPQGSYTEVNIEDVTLYGSTFADDMNLKFWRKSCLGIDSTVTTELFVTQTPGIKGESSLLVYKAQIIQGNNQEEEYDLSPDNALYITKTYRVDAGDDVINYNENFTMIFTCSTNLSALGGTCNNKTIEFPSFGGSVGVSTLSDTSGLWYDPALAGMGFQIVDASFGLSVTYYGYDFASNPLWLFTTDAGPANVVKGVDYTMNVNEPTIGNGGTIGTKPAGAVNGTSSWGNMTINFSSCTAATATISGFDGTQTYNLTKLASGKGASCN